MSLGSLNRTKTAGDTIVDVGVEIGLPKVSDPFISGDSKWQQMVTIANSCGNKLIDLYSWSRLHRRHAFVTVAGQENYDLPADWNAMIDQTMWKSSGLVIGQPISPQEWQYFSNNSYLPVLRVLFRERGGYLSVPPGTPGSVSVNFEYESRGWVSRQAYPNDLFDNVTSFTDIILLDPTLFGTYLKMKFLEAIGFDSQKAADDFNLMLEARTSKDKSAPILNAGRTNRFGARLIDVVNIPETGYGS